MFEQLSDHLTTTLQKLRGRGRLTESNIKDSLREVRMGLLEADVALPVVQEFIDAVREKAVGQQVISAINPGQALIKIVNDELIDILGGSYEALNLNTAPPAVIFMAGLQGSGKTTTVAKLAYLIKTQLGKTVSVSSCDLSRPAAVEQLRVLAAEIDVDFIPPQGGVIASASAAVDTAKRNVSDVLIIDTAGRLHIDEALMDEAKQLHQAVNPIETLFVVDSMTGQDAANTAKAFNDALPITGIILTKVDGDARGGAALSVSHITGKPIKYIGIGEKSDALEVFHPERIASRILGKGDILSIVEEAERKVDKKKTAKLAKKVAKGKGFDLDDMREQMQQMNKMGGVMGLISKLPGMSKVPDAVKGQLDDSAITRVVAIINSMTPQERRFPKVINGSRKKRIARGSGTQIQDINRLLKQFQQMQKAMKKMAKPGARHALMNQLSRFQ